MKQTNSLLSLIKDAAAQTGSESELAKALGIPQQNISGWKAGTRACTPADRSRLAAFAQKDAVQELVRATLEQTKGTLRGEQLRAVLGKWLAQTGAAKDTALLALVSLTLGLTSTDIPRCIKRPGSARLANC